MIKWDIFEDQFRQYLGDNIISLFEEEILKENDRMKLRASDLA